MAPRAAEEEVELEIDLPCLDEDEDEDESSTADDDSLSDSDVDVPKDVAIDQSWVYKVLVVLPKRAHEISCAVQEKQAPLSCGGWAPLCAPVRLKGDLQLLQMPLPEATSSDAIASFASHCTRTQAADGAVLSSQDFVTDFHPLDLGIIEKVQQVLKPEMKLVSKLAKLRVYGAGDASKPQKAGSTSSDGNLVASLVVVLPSTYTGGELVASRGGEEHVFACSNMSSDPSRIHWLCYSSDCELEVKELKSGFLVTLEYNLYSGQPTEAVVDSFPPKLGRMFKEALESREFYKDGALLGFPCQHMYSLLQEHAEGKDPTVKSPREMVPLLKGSDAELYHAARAAGLQVQVRPVWNGFYVGRGFHGLKVDEYGTSEYYSDEWMFKSHLDKYKKKRIEWCHDKGHWEKGLARFSFDHKLGTVIYLKRAIAILVKVLPWSKRLKLATVGSPSPSITPNPISHMPVISTRL